MSPESRAGTIGTFVSSDAAGESMVRRVVADAALRVFTVHLAQGEHLERHLAPSPLVLFVVEGEVDLEVGEERHHLAAGQCCIVPSGAEHALTGLASGESLTVGVLGAEPGPLASDAEPLGDGVVDLLDVLRAGTGRGVLWSLPPGSGINANLARLGTDDGIDEHVNAEMDVTVIALSGEGRIDVGGTGRVMRPGTLTTITAGAARRLRSVGGAFGYLTVHRERSGLTIRR